MVAEWKFPRGGWLQVYQLPERAGGTNPRWRRRVLAALSMLAGAMLGAFTVRFGVSAAVGAALVVEVGSVLLLRGELS